MTTSPGRPHRGRRDNGLDAAAFVAVADVDPRVGEHLLDAFGLAGIAAYLTPSADLHPVVRSTLLPSRPTDRLWVDRDRRQEAWDLLTQVNRDEPDAAPDSGGPRSTGGAPSTGGAATAGAADPLDVDAEWERIIAGYAAPAGAARGWPAAEDTEESAPAPAPSAGPSGAARDDDASARDAATVAESDRVAVPDDTEDEGFTPPPPPPLPRLSRHVVLAVASMAAGLILFFRPDLLGASAGTTLLVAGLCVVGGFSALVYRLRDSGSDDDPDDGAVV